MSADRPLDRRLLALTAASIVPLALMAGIGLFALETQQRAASERVGIELARSVAVAVGAELRATESALAVLGTVPGPDGLDVPLFVDRARRVLATRPDWIAIVLTDRNGVTLADTRLPEDRAHLADVDRDSLDRAARTGEAVVGSLTRDVDRWLFPVRVPVGRGGSIRYVVSALVSPSAVYGVLRRQNVPADWVISIVDAHGHRVARSRANAETVGGRLSASVERVVASGGAEGVGVAYALEGERILTPYSRLAQSGWTAVLGIPTAVVDAAAYRAVALYGLGVALSITIAILASVWVARTIVRPVKALGLAAGAMARGERPPTIDSTIREIAAAGSALRQAFDVVQQAESQRETLLRAERVAREAAESSDRAKDQFLAVLSHELRTPLNAVSGWARMLERGQLRDDPALTRRAISVIVRNADAQAQLIDDLLDLSRFAAGKLQLRLSPTDLASVLQDVMETVRPAADAKHITLRGAFAPDVGLIVGDPDRLRQVAWNLVINAVKFTPEGGSVEVQLRRRGTGVEMCVRDTGCGMSADLVPYVFDRFHQADSSSTRTHGGLGLGLSLVKTLVDLHGGRVSAESEGEGLGATFTVVLPAAASPTPAGAPPARAPAIAVATDSSANLHDVRVLLVDDDGESLQLGREILRRAGADVQTCSSVRAAVEIFDRWRPDVLLSDIEMPGTDGYQLMRIIRALAPDKGARVPAVALTAYGRDEDRRRALEAGFTVHVPKPVDPSELIAIVAGLAGTGTSDAS